MPLGEDETNRPHRPQDLGMGWLWCRDLAGGKLDLFSGTESSSHIQSHEIGWNLMKLVILIWADMGRYGVANLSIELSLARKCRHGSYHSQPSENSMILFPKKCRPSLEISLSESILFHLLNLPSTAGLKKCMFFPKAAGWAILLHYVTHVRPQILFLKAACLATLWFSPICRKTLSSIEDTGVSWLLVQQLEK